MTLQEIQEIPIGSLFVYTDTYYCPPRIYYMRKMRRKPSNKYAGMINRKCIPIQCYGFIQGKKNHFNKKTPAHWCVDGRYKGTVTGKNWNLNKKLIKRVKNG